MTGVPVADGLFEQSEQGPALLGSRCRGCEALYFPTALSCRNPACEDKDLERALLGQRGRLYSWTVQAYRPPALFRIDDWGPYAVGLVEIPDGLRVLGMLTGCPVADLEIDMDLELVLERLYTDEEGRDVLTYKYAPTAP